MEQATKQPKICYDLGKYVTIRHSDGNGHPVGPAIARAVIPRRITHNRPLIAREVSGSTERPIDLGIVREGRNYRKRAYVEIRTDRGWYTIEWNGELALNRTETLHWCELLEPSGATGNRAEPLDH